MDVFGNLCVLIAQFKLVFNIKEDKNAKNKHVFLVMGVLFLGVRALSQLRIIESYRVLIQLFKQSCLDMVNFLAILLYMVFIFALAKMVMRQGQKDLHIDKLSLSMYQVMFGENPDLAKSPRFDWFLYIIFTLLVNVVALNLLISIIG